MVLLKCITHNWNILIQLLVHAIDVVTLLKGWMAQTKADLDVTLSIYSCMWYLFPHLCLKDVFYYLSSWCSCVLFFLHYSFNVALSICSAFGLYYTPCFFPLSHLLLLNKEEEFYTFFKNKMGHSRPLFYFRLFNTVDSECMKKI